MKQKDLTGLFAGERPYIFPVIHVLSTEQTAGNIETVLQHGVSGVFLINHDFGKEKFLPIIRDIRQKYPDLWLGVNFLGTPGDKAFPVLGQLKKEGCMVNGYWADDGRINELEPYLQTEATVIQQVKASSDWNGLYFGGWSPSEDYKYNSRDFRPKGVAFKKQRIVDSSNYKLAASIASHFMDVVCTSGQKTGSAPDINKIRAFREACGDTCLAVASGITPDNISQYSNMVDIILVATGVSPPGDFHNVDGSLLSKLLSAKQSAYRGPAWYLSLMKENTLGPSKAWLDPSGIYTDPDGLRDLVNDMVAPFNPDQIDAVVGIDGMGFPTGGAIAYKLNKAFVVVRKGGKLCVPTDLIEFVDYSGHTKSLELRKDNPFPRGGRVLIVDQWVETGGTMVATIELIERAGATVAGITAICIEKQARDKLTGYKTHECVPEHLHHLFDDQIFSGAKHAHLIPEPK